MIHKAIARLGFAFMASTAVGLSTPVAAQQISTGYISSFADGVLVTSNDVTTCPYTVIGGVSVNMRAKTYALKELQGDAIGDKLRKNAKKMGADAVVLVTVGQTHMTLTALRSTPITGRAIKYVDTSCAPRA